MKLRFSQIFVLIISFVCSMVIASNAARHIMPSVDRMFTCGKSTVQKKQEIIKLVKPKKVPHISLDRLKKYKNILPCAIIGSGPAGLSASVYGSRLGLPTYVFEGSNPGGLLMQTTDVENWPGNITIQGPEIIRGLRLQASHTGVKFINAHVTEIDLSVWPYKVITDDDEVFRALTIIYATGATPKLPGFEGQDTYWGRGITTCAVCDAAFYRGKDVVVIGGGDSAAEEAMQLSLCKSVTILVRKDAMRASAAMQQRLKGYPNISIKYNSEVVKVFGTENNITGITIRDTCTGEQSDMPIDGIFIAIGHTPNTDLLAEYTNIDPNGYFTVIDRSQRVQEKNGAAPIFGVYAAGDVEDSVYRQAAVASASGVKAAMDAYKDLTDIGYNNVIAKGIESQLPILEKKGEPTQALAAVTTDAELEEILQSEDKIVLLDCYTTACSSCKALVPILEEVATMYADTLRIIKVNLDDAADIKEKYKIKKVPTLLFFKNGELAGSINKFVQKQELTQFIDKIIAASNE